MIDRYELSRKQMGGDQKAIGGGQEMGALEHLNDLYRQVKEAEQAFLRESVGKTFHITADTLSVNNIFTGESSMTFPICYVHVFEQDGVVKIKLIDTTTSAMTDDTGWRGECVGPDTGIKVKTHYNRVYVVDGTAIDWVKRLTEPHALVEGPRPEIQYIIDNVDEYGIDGRIHGFWVRGEEPGEHIKAIRQFMQGIKEEE